MGDIKITFALVYTSMHTADMLPMVCMQSLYVFILAGVVRSVGHN